MTEITPNNPYFGEIDRLQVSNEVARDRDIFIERAIGRLQDIRRRNKEERHNNFEAIESAKLKALQFVLSEGKLGICDRSGPHDRLLLNTDETDLGIFPKSMLRFLYKKVYNASGYSAWYEIYIATLCPQHFPQNPNEITPAKKLESMMEVSSEVEQFDDQFIRLLDNEDAQFTKFWHKKELVEIPLRQRYSSRMFEYYGLPKPDNLRFQGFTNYWHCSVVNQFEHIEQVTFDAPGPSWLKYG